MEEVDGRREGQTDRWKEELLYHHGRTDEGMGGRKVEEGQVG